jgi:hypothetical protein
MRLQLWMRMNRYNDRAFIKEINDILVKNQVVMKRPYGWRSVAPWRVGICVPRPHVVSAIEELTKGEVTYRDHVETVNEADFRTTKHKTPAINGAAS